VRLDKAHDRLLHSQPGLLRLYRRKRSSSSGHVDCDDEGQKLFSLSLCSTAMALSTAIPLTRLPLRAHAIVGWESMYRISERVAGLLLLGGWASFGVDCAAGTITSDSRPVGGERTTAPREAWHGGGGWTHECRRMEALHWDDGEGDRLDDGQRALVSMQAGVNSSMVAVPCSE
jgi:hypothetical protein